MSNILANAFLLTKDIENDTIRNCIRDSFNSIHKDDKFNSTLGYHGRHLYKQFLGYLFVNGNRGKLISEMQLPIPEMPDGILCEFEKGHSFINTVNNYCLNPLVELIPNSYKVINPYWEMGRGLKNSSENIKIKYASFDRLVQSFQLDKPYKILRNRLRYIPKIKEMKEEDVYKAVYSLLERIKKFGLKHYPEDFVALSFSINQKNPESMLAAILFCLIHIFSSLKSIDQILFQSFISDKLTCLDEDNVFNIISMQSNIISDIIEVGTVETIPFPGDVIIVKLPHSVIPYKDNFCLIENIELKFSQDYGNETIVGMRCINNSASYYGNLLKNIKEI